VIPGIEFGRVDQIAILAPDLEAAMDAYIAKLGVTFAVFEANETSSSFSGSSSRFRIRIAVALAGALSIELIQPVAGVTLYSNHLESRGAGLHHLGVHVPDLVEARKSFSGPGNRCVLEGRIHGLGEFAYFEAPDLHCCVELLQLPLAFPIFLAQSAQVYSGRARQEP
jgi:catechol 2,3-dioxygenase-like lactoylglutathione lyase family enzyme